MNANSVKLPFVLLPAYPHQNALITNSTFALNDNLYEAVGQTL